MLSEQAHGSVTSADIGNDVIDEGVQSVVGLSFDNRKSSLAYGVLQLVIIYEVTAVLRDGYNHSRTASLSNVVQMMATTTVEQLASVMLYK